MRLLLIEDDITLGEGLHCVRVVLKLTLKAPISR